jgi:5-methylthioadenosine/S-adenosylhomocysteine deaminase
MIRERFGKGWVEVLNDLGVVGPRFQGAHCVWIEEKEMDILAKMKATIVHNPSSNMILSSGIAPVARMLNHGVRVALGSDSCRDLISAMGLASGLQKVSTLDPMALKAWDVLRMATLNGAEAFGMEDEIGSLRPGKKADITVVNLRAPHIAPIRDPVTALVYFAHSSDVDTVIVDGKIVLDNRVVKTVDEDAVLEKVQAHASEAATRAGLPA